MLFVNLCPLLNLLGRLVPVISPLVFIILLLFLSILAIPSYSLGLPLWVLISSKLVYFLLNLVQALSLWLLPWTKIFYVVLVELHKSPRWSLSTETDYYNDSFEELCETVELLFISLSFYNFFWSVILLFWWFLWSLSVTYLVLYYCFEVASWMTTTCSSKTSGPKESLFLPLITCPILHPPLLVCVVRFFYPS